MAEYLQVVQNTIDNFMKKISFLLIALGCACAINAQPLNLFQPHGKNTAYANFVKAMLARNPAITAAKTTAVKERVIAQVFYMANTIQDSTRFIYNSSNHNGSKFDYSSFQYPYGFGYDGTTAIDNVNGFHHKPYVLADVVLDFNSYSGSFGLVEQTISTYDANNNITVYNDTFLDGSNNSQYYVANYNAQNNIVNVTNFQPINNVYDSFNKTFYRYYQNQLVADSTYSGGTNSFTLYSRNDYTYDNAGNLTLLVNSMYNGTTTATPQGRFINTYTASNQLNTSEDDQYNGNQWQLNTKDVFGYTSGVSFYTYYKETNSYSAIPDIINYHVSSSGVPDSLYGSIDTNGPAAVPFKVIITYNSFNDPVNFKEYFGSGSFFYPVPQQENRYYYETYNPAAVKNVTATADNVKVYPNPATTTLYISGTDGTKGGVLVSLTNTLGQLLMTQTSNSTGVQSVNIAALKPGMYTLSVSDVAGNRLHTQTIIKQ